MFDPSGARVLTASWDCTARLWDAATGAELAVLRGHEGGVSSAVFDPSGARALTASRDKTARLWDAASGAELAVLRGHEGGISSAVFDPSGARVLTASWRLHGAAVGCRERRRTGRACVAMRPGSEARYSTRPGRAC